MSLNEIDKLKTDLGLTLKNKYSVENSTLELMEKSLEKNPNSGLFPFNILAKRKLERSVLKKIKADLKSQNFTKKNYSGVIKLVKNEIVITRRIKGLVLMQNLLRYWHVAHLPIALIMLVVMIIHVVIAVTFGYKWIF